MYGNVFWEVNILATVSLHQLMDCKVDIFAFKVLLREGEKTK